MFSRTLAAFALSGLLMVVAPRLWAGDPNLRVSPATVHAVSHDANVTLILVSGEVSFPEGLPPYTSSRFAVTRVPIIYRRHADLPPPNIPTRTMLGWFTAPMREGRAVDISCLGAQILRDGHEQVQAILCTDIGCSPLGRAP